MELLSVLVALRAILVVETSLVLQVVFLIGVDLVVLPVQGVLINLLLDLAHVLLVHQENMLQGQEILLVHLALLILAQINQKQHVSVIVVILFKAVHVHRS